MIKEIKTERLIIRNFVKEDGHDLYDYLSKEKVVKFEPYKPFTLEQAIQEAEKRSLDDRYYAVTLNNGKLIGNLYLAKGNMETLELGYVFNDTYWKQGYASESARALLQYAFDQEKAWRVTAYCDPQNPNSWKLLERLGFRREAHFKKNIYFFKDDHGNPLWKDSYAYAILREEWNDNDITN